MRLLFDKQELEEVGKPTQSDLLWTAFMCPLFLVLGGISAFRLIRASIGYELTLSAVFDKTLSLSGGVITFAAGISLYIVILLITLVGLWWCAVQVQRWYYWRK